MPHDCIPTLWHVRTHGLSCVDKFSDELVKRPLLFADPFLDLNGTVANEVNERIFWDRVLQVLDFVEKLRAIGVALAFYDQGKRKRRLRMFFSIRGTMQNQDKISYVVSQVKKQSCQHTSSCVVCLLFTILLSCLALATSSVIVIPNVSLSRFVRISSCC